MKANVKDNQRRYGVWAGNPDGRAEDPVCCVESVYDRDTMLTHQCGRKRGKGPDGLYCGVHARRFAD